MVADEEANVNPRRGRTRMTAVDAPLQGRYCGAKIWIRLLFSSTTTTSWLTGSIATPYGTLNWPLPVPVVPNLLKNAPADGDVINFTGGTIHLSNGGLPPAGVDVPSTNGRITYSSAAAIATTSFNVGTNTWETVVPLSWGKHDVFLAGVQYSPPAGLTGGAKATWTGSISEPNANWQFATSVYDPFGAYNALGVKPIGSSTLTSYTGSDKLGTPMNMKNNLKSGAMGGGGSNFIGSWSSTKAVCPD